MVVSTELYAKAGLFVSAPSTCCTVHGPFCQRTSIKRSSASVNVGDLLGGNGQPPSCLLRRAGSRNVTNYLVVGRQRGGRWMIDRAPTCGF